MENRAGNIEKNFFGMEDPLGEEAQRQREKDRVEKQKVFDERVIEKMKEIQENGFKDEDCAGTGSGCYVCGVIPTSVNMAGNCMYCGSSVQEPAESLRWAAEDAVKKEQENKK